MRYLTPSVCADDAPIYGRMPVKEGILELCCLQRDYPDFYRNLTLHATNLGRRPYRELARYIDWLSKEVKAPSKVRLISL